MNVKSVPKVIFSFFLFFCIIMFISSVSTVSAANSTNTTSFTPSEITNASVAVQKQIETNKKLPENVAIGNQTVNTAQYLHLAVEAISQIQQNNNKSISIKNDQVPQYSEESLISGSISRADYLDFANRIDEYINNNHQAPPYGFIGLGKISYQSQVYLFSRILNVYYTNGSLPLYINLKPFTSSNIPILYTPATTFTTTQIIQTAINLQKTIETTKTIPNTVTINGTTIYTAQFLHLTIQTTMQLKSSSNNPIALQNDQAPSYTQEQLNTGTLTLNDYVDFAQRLNDYMNNNQQAAPYGLIGPGKIGYQSQVYLFTRILTMYNSTRSLPSSIIVKSWTADNIPILSMQSVSFTPQQIVDTAVKLKNTIELTKTIPSTVVINGITIYTAQFLHLAVEATVQLNENNGNKIFLQSDEPPGYIKEELVSGVLFKDEYLDFARRVSDYMNENHQAPPYGYIGLGTISYQSQVYLFMRVLDYYNTSKSLADNIVVKSWSSQNIPLNQVNIAFSIDQIALTSNGVRNNVEIYKALPEFAYIEGLRVNIAQFLYLTVQAVVQINNHDSSPIKVENYRIPGYSEEQLSSGSLSTEQYVDFAKRIMDYMNENQQGPPYGYIGLGKICFQSQVYIYSLILDSYRISGSLPAVSDNIKPWLSVIYNIPAGYEQYCVPTRYCQSDDPSMIALASSITVSAFSIYDKAVLIFEWVRDNIGFEFYYNTVKGAMGTLQSGAGNCVDTTHLLVALCRASGIPARYVQGDCYFSSGNWYGHVWAMIYVNNQWYWADATSYWNDFGTISNWDTGSYVLKGAYTSLPF